jgi:hypothetical protein
MDQHSAGTLGRLNSYQVAGLAVLTSAIAAGAVLIIMRRFVFQTPDGSETSRQEAERTMSGAEIPTHFSEDLIIPGKTATGPEIEDQDATEGRSPEGV